MRFYRARPTGLMFLAPRSAFPLSPIAARVSSPLPSMGLLAEGPTNEAQEEGGSSVKAQLRDAIFERGTCQKLGTLHHRGERTREVGEGDSDAEFADLALCPHAVRGGPPQG